MADVNHHLLEPLEQLRDPFTFLPQRLQLLGRGCRDHPDSLLSGSIKLTFEIADV
jgi:hypothetical protein